MKKCKTNRSEGFTLLELMVAIAIIGILASIAIPNYSAYRDKAFHASCLSNRRHIEQAAKTYIMDHESPDLSIIDSFKCPQNGVYIWQDTDTDSPSFGSVACSLHYTSIPSDPQFSMPTGENITANSDFETLGKVPKPQSWTITPTSKVDGWEANGSIMEVWSSGMLGVTAPEGEYFIELDSYGNVPDSIYQEIETEKGRVYEVWLKARARKNGTSDFEISWGDKTIEQITPEKGKWNSYSVQVVGTGDPIKVAISEVPGQSDGLGTLLDSIEIIPTDEIR